MEVVKLKPVIKSYIWGGAYFQKYGKGSDLPIISELWELSLRDNNSSIIETGPFKGKTIQEVINKEDVGPVVKTFKYFPLLIKLIDAEDATSVQVHPNDDYALKYENSFGKSEMWHVISCEKGSGVYVGFKKDVTKEEVEERLHNGTILEILNFFEAKPGDTFVIDPGTIHAVGKGVRFLEVQQNSDITYRLYDYGRVDKDGNPRPLHFAKGLENIDYKKYKGFNKESHVLADNEFFTVKSITIKDEIILKADGDSFKSFTFIEGEGLVNDIPYKKFDTFFLPYNKECVIKGTGRLVVSEVKNKTDK